MVSKDGDDGIGFFHLILFQDKAVPGNDLLHHASGQTQSEKTHEMGFSDALANWSDDTRQRSCKGRLGNYSTLSPPEAGNGNAHNGSYLN
jgi:hypothetical protein